MFQNIFGVLQDLVEFGLGYAKIMTIATTMIRRIVRAHLATRSAARKGFATLRASNDLKTFAFVLANVDYFLHRLRFVRRRFKQNNRLSNYDIVRLGVSFALLALGFGRVTIKTLFVKGNAYRYECSSISYCERSQRIHTSCSWVVFVNLYL